MRHPSADAILTDDFLLEEVRLGPLVAGEVLVRIRYLSLDPYLANRMRCWEGMDAAWREGIVTGRFVGEVAASADDRFQAGDAVSGAGAWQTWQIIPAGLLQHIDTNTAPVQAWLGALGPSGITAWVGVNRVLCPEPGATVTVSSAAGIVGSIAGQLMQAKGCRVIGIAGGSEKCRWVEEEARFDRCLDHFTQDLAGALTQAAPTGIDRHFENVGSKTLDPILKLMRDGGRVALCGLVAHYQDGGPIALQNFRELLMRAIVLQGFRVADYTADFRVARQELGALLQSGSLAVNETVTVGLEQAPQAYVNMLGGSGLGKHLVRLD